MPRFDRNQKQRGENLSHPENSRGVIPQNIGPFAAINSMSAVRSQASDATRPLSWAGTAGQARPTADGARNFRGNHDRN